MLASLSPEQRAAVEEQHRKLREEAQAAGLTIPALGEPLAAVNAPAAPAQPESGSGGGAWQAVVDSMGAAAQVEQAGSSDEVVFRFGAADGQSGALLLPAGGGLVGADPRLAGWLPAVIAGCTA